MADGVRTGIVGATGAVGAELLAILAERQFPVGELRLLASARSGGTTLRFRGREHPVAEATPQSFAGLDLVLFSAGADRSRALAPAALDAGAFVVDNSSAFRNDPAIPLVVPEINGALLDGKPRLVANPNCTTIVFLMPFAPIHRQVPCREAVFASYQAVSGTGAAAMAELEAQTRAWAAREPAPAPSVYPKPIAFNVLPLVGELDADGVSSEEAKGQQETRKILGDPSIHVSCTCVRVPTWRAHAVAARVWPERAVTVDEVRAWIDAAPGVRCVPRDVACGPTPQEAAGLDDVLVGRLRVSASPRPALSFFACGDQLRKGAALNAIQIAERLLGVA